MPATPYVSVRNKGGNKIPQGVALHRGIAVHRDQDFACAPLEPRIQGVSLALIEGLPYGEDAPAECCPGRLNPGPGVVNTAVVHGNELKFVLWVVAGCKASKGRQNLPPLVVCRHHHCA